MVAARAGHRSSRKDCPGCAHRRPRYCVALPWHSRGIPRPHSAGSPPVQKLHCHRSCSADNSSAGSSPDSDPVPASPPGGSIHPERRETCSIAVASPPCRRSDCETADCACRSTPPCAHQPGGCSPRSAPAHRPEPPAPRPGPTRRQNAGSALLPAQSYTCPSSTPRQVP